MTREERYLFYKKLLKVVCDDPSCITGFCYYINSRMGRKGIDVYREEIFKKELPELYSLKPNKLCDEDYWFSCNEEGWKKRIELIEKAIEMTK